MKNRHFYCILYYADKGKPIKRWGRKATDLSSFFYWGEYGSWVAEGGKGGIGTRKPIPLSVFLIPTFLLGFFIFRYIITTYD